MTTANLLPTTVAEISPKWLNEQLTTGGYLAPGEAVHAIHVEQIGEGKGFLSDVYRLHLQGDGPNTLIAKFQTSTAMREGAEAADVYRREVRFYQDIAPYCPMHTPQVYLAEVDAAGTALLLLEDLHDLEATDHITGLNYAKTERLLKTLAAQHAWSCGQQAAKLDEQIFKRVPEHFNVATRFAEAIPSGWEIYCENRRRDHSDQLAQLVTNIPHLALDMQHRLATPACLVHGDIRVDNLFYDQDRIVIVDHQFAHVGSGLIDVAYLLSHGLTTATRQGNDYQLVTLYQQALNAGGVSLSANEAWQQYCDAVLFMVCVPLGAIRGWPMFGERARDLLLTIMERWIATVEELALAEKYQQNKQSED